MQFAVRKLLPWDVNDNMSDHAGIERLLSSGRAATTLREHSFSCRQASHALDLGDAVSYRASQFRPKNARLQTHATGDRFPRHLRMGGHLHGMANGE